MRYAIARLSMQVQLPDGGFVSVSVRRVIYSVDRRDIADLVGRELWVYWHPAFPSLAVPETLC